MRYAKKKLPLTREREGEGEVLRRIERFCLSLHAAQSLRLLVSLSCNVEFNFVPMFCMGFTPRQAGGSGKFWEGIGFFYLCLTAMHVLQYNIICIKLGMLLGWPMHSLHWFFIPLRRRVKGDEGSDVIEDVCIQLLVEASVNTQGRPPYNCMNLRCAALLDSISRRSFPIDEKWMKVRKVSLS